MTGTNVFSYVSGASISHRLDVRFKLVFLIVLSLASLHGSARALLILTGVLLALARNAGIAFGPVVRQLRYVFILLGLIFAARSLSTPGTAVFEYGVLIVTGEGLYAGAMVCWRLTAVILLSLLFVRTTRPSAIKASVEWFLRPVPLVPEKRVSMMISLLLRFLPVILEEAKETLDAQRARSVENRKNPVYRVRKIAIPVLRRIFLRADKLALAMEARCYSENRTDPELYAGGRDWIALFAVAGLCVLIVGV